MEDGEEAELQAALMARKAERAELKAIERKLLKSQDTSNQMQSDRIRFISKKERLLREDETINHNGQEISQKPISIRRLPSKSLQQQEVVNNHQRRESKRQNDHRAGKRFKFEWDESEDTLNGFNDQYFDSSTTIKVVNQDYLLRLADERASRNLSDEVWSDLNEKPVEKMTERDWKIFRENYDIRVRGTSVPHPARSWDEMQLPKHLRLVLFDVGYTKPTPIQMQAVPIGLTSNDMIGIAETGSGKTCAFVLPFLTRLSQEPWYSMRKKCDEDGPLVLILAPTRELVSQIEDEVIKLSALASNPIRSIAIYGGSSSEEQAFRLQQGIDVVVATPGRLIDLLNTRIAVLNHCSYIVLDEADRMIDMGFEPQVNKILESLVVPREFRTTFMFSATMPSQIILLAQKFMRASPIIIRIGDEESGKNRKIEQHIRVLASEFSKEAELDRLLSNSEPPIIIFCNSKANCDLLVKALKYRGRKACTLHGGRNQEEREENFRKFKEGIYHILVATDVAGRGLHVEGVSHVINYDCPTTRERYIHRIGRTARAGRSGKATTLVVKDTDEPEVLSEIADCMKDTGQEVPRELVDLIGDYRLNQSIQD